MRRFKEIFDEKYPFKWAKFQEFGRNLQQIIGYNFADEENLWHALAIRGSKITAESNFEKDIYVRIVNF